MTDDYISRIEAALEAEPTPGIWEYREVDGLGAVAHPSGWIEAVQASSESECIDAAYIAACNPVAIRALLDRLRTAEDNVRKANAQAEHFEREWYLRGDEIEQLRAALRTLIDQRDGHYSTREAWDAARAALENTDAR